MRSRDPSISTSLICFDFMPVDSGFLSQQHNANI